MNPKYISTVRWKFIWAFMLSAISGAGVLTAGYQMVNSMLYLNPAPSTGKHTAILRWIINHIGSAPMLAAAGIISFLFFFFHIYEENYLLS